MLEEEFFPIECDGCCQELGGYCYESEWREKFSKKLNLCSTCNISYVTTDTLRRVGMRDLAARIDNQEMIDDYYSERG